MGKETIRDHIPWDDYNKTRDIVEDKKKIIHNTYIDAKGVWMPEEARTQLEELEARRMLNAISKQKKRK